jgi:hypothetical protein
MAEGSWADATAGIEAQRRGEWLVPATRQQVTWGRVPTTAPACGRGMLESRTILR